VIVSLLYKVARKLLSEPVVLLRSEAAKDAELLVLRHENAVLHRQLTDPVRYEPADRFWFAALSGLVDRTADSCPASGTTPPVDASNAHRHQRRSSHSCLRSVRAVREQAVRKGQDGLGPGVAESGDAVPGHQCAGGERLAGLHQVSQTLAAGRRAGYAPTAAVRL
jgi:hypothetical protein